MVETQQSYREFLSKVDNGIKNLPQFLQQELKPALFHAWVKTTNMLGVDDTEEHIEFFVRYVLNSVGNIVCRDILLAILQNAWEGLA